MERINLAQDSNQWRAGENSEMGFHVEQTKRISQVKNEMEKEMKEKMTVHEKNEDIPSCRVFVEMLLIPGIVNKFLAIYRT